MADQWDRQIEQDMHAGRLDAALKRADNHYEAGRCSQRSAGVAELERWAFLRLP